MRWVRKMFRGGKVWAEVDEDGRLVVDHGVVRIRYQEQDERGYSARATDITDIDESKLRKKVARAAATPRKGPVARRSESQKRTGEKTATRGAIVIYTDGACYGNPGPSGIGVLLEWNGRSREISRYLGEGTNNTAELSAILEALRAVKKKSYSVRLYTDSSYAIGVLSMGWKVRQNRELVDRVQREMAGFKDLELLKVKGHAGDPRNERVDLLARDAIDHRRREDDQPS